MHGIPSHTCPLPSTTAGSGHTLPGPGLGMEAAGPGARFTAEAIRAMSADDVIDAWKENLKELSR